MESVVRLLADLVAIPSMNPMGRGRAGKHYEEQALAEFIGSFLRRHDIDVQTQEVAPGRPNVIGHIDAKALQTLLLEAHLDTAQVEGMTIEPFDPRIRDGRLYGRGSCDTKGSLAAFLQGTVAVLATPQKLSFNIVLLFVSDEEYRFTGAQHAVKCGLKADFGIAGEPTRLAIVRAHKGVTRWRIITKGVAAHSAYPDRGRNAIYAMSKVVDRLEEHGNRLLAGERHPVLGTPTLSVGVIEGGQAVNVVPDRCWIEIDRRTLPGETAENAIESVKAVLQDSPDLELEAPYLSVAGMEVAEDTPIVQRLARSIKEIAGTAAIEAASYATDAGFYNSAGIPTVVFGPGDIAQAHTKEEYIELHQLHQAVDIVRRFLTT